MINNLLALIFSLLFSSCVDDKIKTTERISAVLIEPGYYVSENDSTFEFMSHRYLINTIESFDDRGMICKVAIRKSEGYLEFSRAEFSKLKDFLKQHGFSDNLQVFLQDDKYVTVNKKTWVIKGVDRNNKKIFYSSNRKNDILYCLIYK